MPGHKFGPAWFPGLVVAGLGLCGLALLVSGVRQRGPWLAFPDWIQRPKPRAAVAAVVIGLLFYILVADWLGFYITGIVLLTFWIRVLGASWRVTLLVSVAATIAIHFAFYKALRVPLPWGLLERWAF